MTYVFFGGGACVVPDSINFGRRSTVLFRIAISESKALIAEKARQLSKQIRAVWASLELSLVKSIVEILFHFCLK